MGDVEMAFSASAERYPGGGDLLSGMMNLIIQVLAAVVRREAAKNTKWSERLHPIVSIAIVNIARTLFAQNLPNRQHDQSLHVSTFFTVV